MGNWGYNPYKSYNPTCNWLEPILWEPTYPLPRVLLKIISVSLLAGYVSSWGVIHYSIASLYFLQNIFFLSNHRYLLSSQRKDYTPEIEPPGYPPRKNITILSQSVPWSKSSNLVYMICL